MSKMRKRSRLLPEPAPAARGEAPAATPLLDVAPDAAFEAAARVAAQLMAAPIGFVALMHEGSPRIAACVGLAARDLDRAFAVRAHQGDDADAPVVIDALATDALLGASARAAAARGLDFYAGAPVRDAAGAPLGTVGVLDVAPRSADAGQRAALRDLASVVRLAMQARRQADELTRQAVHDPLTGLASRRPFEQALQVELHHSMRTGEPFTLLRLSLDGIGDIRNGFGVAAAEGALREVAARIARQVRLGDVLARLGGDEFAVVMRHGATSAAEVLATRIVEAVRLPLTLASGEAVGVRVCIGIAAYTDEVESSCALQAHAEHALVAARREYDRRWNFFGRKFDGAALRLVETAAAAPDAEPAG